jgi:hypothetical protein
MKRFVAAVSFVLALVVCCAPVMAEAFPVWSNGQSAQQPFEGVSPVDLTEQLGYMVLDPLNNENVDVALDELKIYLPRTDVQAGEGLLKLYVSRAKEPLQEIAFSDEKRVAIAPIDAETLEWLCWETGSSITISLLAPLEVDKTYSVFLEEDCIVASQYGLSNAQLDGAAGWTFSTMADFGVVGRKRSGDDAPKAGDSAAVEVKLGTGATSASFFCDTGDVSCDDLPLEESGVLTVRYENEGPVSWGIALIDDDSGAVVSVYRYNEQVLP